MSARRSIPVQLGPGEVVVTLTTKEIDEIVNCLDFTNKNDPRLFEEEKRFNRGLRKKMIKRQKRCRQLTRELEGD